MDSETLLPANGQALLEMVKRAEERVRADDYGAAGGLPLGFESPLQVLAESGVLDSNSNDLCVVEVRAASAVVGT